MITEEKKQVLEYFSEGRKRYLLMDFDGARKYFAQALKILPEDGPSKVYYKRCVEFLKKPPPDDWDGVTTMEEK